MTEQNKDMPNQIWAQQTHGKLEGNWWITDDGNTPRLTQYIRADAVEGYMFRLEILLDRDSPTDIATVREVIKGVIQGLKPNRQRRETNE